MPMQKLSKYYPAGKRKWQRIKKEKEKKLKAKYGSIETFGDGRP